MNAQRTGRQQLPFIYVLSQSRNTLEHLPESVTHFLVIIFCHFAFPLVYLAKKSADPGVMINSPLVLPQPEKSEDKQSVAVFRHFTKAVFLRHK